VIRTWDRVVQVFRFDSKRDIVPVFVVQLDVMVPAAISFVDRATKDICVFSVFDGNL
jgi:hypothetical protein